MVRAVMFLLLVATALAAGGCSHETGTDLTIKVDNTLGSARYQLRCDPARGDVPRPQALCELLDEHSDAMLTGGQVICGDANATLITVSGRFRDERVSDEGVDACHGNPEGARLWLAELPESPR